MLQRQTISNQINSRLTPAINLKIGTFVSIPNFTTQKRISKKLQPLRKGPYKINDKPTEVTFKLTDSSKKEIVQRRNNLLPYYPKEYALRELTQLFSFTGLQIIQDNPEIEKTKTLMKQKIKKTTQQKNIAPQPSQTREIKIPQKRKKK